MKCALCLEGRKLCNSHIVPDFLFRRLQEKERSFYVFSASGEERRTFHKTFSEKLLCSDCETRFSQWESYAAQFFSDKIPLTGRPQGRHLALSGVDYTPMKLFFMSLLWRFAVTTNPWLKGCDLGVHKERLRLRLLASDAAEPWRYGCSITAITVDGTHLPDLIVPPSVCRVDGHFCHRLIVGGYILAYFVTSHEPKAPIRSIVFQEDGRFILSRSELHDIPFLREVVAKAVFHKSD